MGSDLNATNAIVRILREAQVDPYEKKNWKRKTIVVIAMKYLIDPFLAILILGSYMIMILIILTSSTNYHVVVNAIRKMCSVVVSVC